jgi:hypothetical protein
MSGSPLIARWLPPELCGALPVSNDDAIVGGDVVSDEDVR